MAQIDGRLISVSCGVDIKTDGSLFNNARETHAASYYAVIMFVVEVCSMVISARFMLLLNGRARVSRLSYLMALFILAFDVCMLLYHFNFILDIPRASRPLGLLCMMLLVICFTFDLLIFTIIKTENDRQRNRNRRRTRLEQMITSVIIIVFVGLFAYFYNKLPYWITFCILLIVSSFWVAQSVFAIVKNAPKRFLAVDYFLV